MLRREQRIKQEDAPLEKVDSVGVEGNHAGEEKAGLRYRGVVREINHIMFNPEEQMNFNLTLLPHARTQHCPHLTQLTAISNVREAGRIRR